MSRLCQCRLRLEHELTVLHPSRPLLGPPAAIVVASLPALTPVLNHLKNSPLSSAPDPEPAAASL